MRGYRSELNLGILCIAIAFGFPSGTTAQSGGPGFLFNEPQGRFGIWGGYSERERRKLKRNTQGR